MDSRLTGAEPASRAAHALCVPQLMLLFLRQRARSGPVLARVIESRLAAARAPLGPEVLSRDASSRPGYKDLDWQRVIYHIAAKIGIVTFWLRSSVCSRRASQKRIAARLCWRGPIVFPAAPCVPAYRIDEISLNPRCAAIEADPYFSDVGVSGPSGAKDSVGAARSEPLVYTRTRDLRLQFHFRERSPNGYSLGIIPKRRSRKFANSPEMAAWPQRSWSAT